MANNYNIGTQLEESEIYASGIAYVVIPGDVDRDKYIAECYKTSTVSIYSEHIGFRNRVPIDFYSINFVKFPLQIQQFGSAVSFKSDPIRKKPVVDGLYFKSDELCDLREHQFKFNREHNGNFVEISGSPDGKYLTLNVSADKGGEVHVNVKSTDESGKVSIKVDGTCEISSLTDTILKQYGKLTLVTINRNDENEYTVSEQTSAGRTIYSAEETINSTEIVVNTESNTTNVSGKNIVNIGSDGSHELNTPLFKINSGKENFVLGQQFKAFLTGLITQLASSTVMVNGTPQPLINAPEIALYKNNISNFLSQVGFIDK